MNERNIRFGGGFTQECMNAFKQDGAKVHALFEQLFIRLPLFGVIGEKVFVVHGGLPRFDDVKIEQLRRMQYKMDWSKKNFTKNFFCSNVIFCQILFEIHLKIKHFASKIIKTN